MPLTVDRYTVLLQTDPATEPAEHEVTLVNGDRLRAELEGPKHGITSPDKSPMHYMTLCLWAACLRTKVLDGVDFAAFKDMCLDFEEVEEPPVFPGEQAPADPMGPTEAGTGSLSSSPESSATSPAGSTPTPTPV